ncbi:MAG: hypothetical protein PUB21_04515 [Bacteroidales bacterium]|nr:hypothetical protein [Bacteroidales bacterium]
MKKRIFSFVLFFFTIIGTSASVPKYAEIKPYNGRPTIHVNGQPVSPNFYALTHATGGRWSWEEVPQRNLKQFYDMGFRLFQVDLYFEDIWYEEKKELDIEKARKQLRGVLEVAPEAAIVLRVHTNAPYWWNKANRDECTEYADGPIQEEYQPGLPHNNEDFDNERSLRASLASEKWRKEAGERLKELCDGLAVSPEGDALIGMHISGGIYGEWHYWGFISHEPDTGKAMTTYFRKWLKNKYGNDKNLQKAWNRKDFTLTDATVPGTEERNTTHFGFFKDPQQDQRVIDYFTAQQEVVVEDIEYFSKIVKDKWPRPLITGVFYGYIHMTFNRQTVGGHLFIERILNCPTLDYLAAPQTYWNDSRAMGGSGNSRGIVESTLLHGKLWLDEMDNGEYQKKAFIDPVRYVERYDPDYAPLLRRCALFPLMRGIGLWYYDFGPRESLGWWDDPRYRKTIREEKELFDQRLHIPYKSEADLLYVWSMDNFYYLKPGYLPITFNVLDQSVEEALRSGVVGDHIYDFDLDKVNLDQYKAVIFMNNYVLTDAQKKFIKDKVAKNSRTLIFNYLTGITDGKKIDYALSEKLIDVKVKPAVAYAPQGVEFLNPGFRYDFDGTVDPMVVIDDPDAEPLAYLKGTKQVIAAKKKFPGYNVVFAALPINGTDVFRSIFKDAGCHVYNEANDFTYCNTGLLLIHTKDGGKRDIHLKNGKTLSLDLAPKSNTLLDANTGSIILK